MVKVRCNEPATCEKCGMNFDNNGKDRYCVLRRHMSICKSMPIPQTIINNNTNNFSNCIVNFNFGDSVRSIMNAAKDDKAFIEKLTGYMRQIGSAELTALCLFDKIHCNPEHPECAIAVIPNVSRNCMLVKEPEGDTRAMSKAEGAEKALSIFFDSSVPIVNESIKSGAVQKKLQVAENMDDMPKRLIRKLEAVDKDLRKKQKEAIE